MTKSLLEKYQALAEYIQGLATEMNLAGRKAMQYQHSSTSNLGVASICNDVSDSGNKVLLENSLSSDDFSLSKRLARAEQLLNDAYCTHTLNKDGRYPIEDYFKEHGLTFVHEEEKGG
jgi:hypothetical protein